MGSHETINFFLRGHQASFTARGVLLKNIVFYLLHRVGIDEALSPPKGAVLAQIHGEMNTMNKSAAQQTIKRSFKRLGSLGMSSSLWVDAREADLVSFNCPLGFLSKAGYESEYFSQGKW